MVTVGVLDISPFYDENTRTEYMNKLSAFRFEKASRIKTPKEQARSVGAGLLLEKMLKDSLELPETAVKELEYGLSEHGKPYLKNFPKEFFNLSHSGDYVVCALADRTVGIDIQERGKYKESVAKRFYSKEELLELEQADCDEKREELFYQIWAGKESYTKWMETGLTVTLSDFSVHVQKEKVTGKVPCNLKFLNIHSKYSCCVAYTGETDIIWKQISSDAF